jgi:mRNA-degrading endonuclease toxin of MazEF toxin-antitoxin module
VKRGEVWWHEPPDEKPRPVLVLTRGDVIARALDVVAMPVSRTAKMDMVCRALASATSCGRN